MRLASLSISCVIACASLALLSACIPATPPPPPPPPTPQALAAPLMKEWFALEADPNTVIDQRVELGGRIAMLGSEALEPMLDILADPESSHDAKIHVRQAVARHMRPAHFEQLKAITQSQDGGARALGAILIGYAGQNPEATEWLRYLYENDPEHRVRFAALEGLVLHFDEDARETFMGMYWDDELHPYDKEEIVRVVLMKGQPREVDILLDAVQQDWLLVEYRTMVAAALARNGRTQAIEPLQASLEVEKDEGYRVFAQQAIAALEALPPDSTE